MGSGQVLDPEENVSESGEADLIGRKFPSEPLMSIQVNLDLHGEPALNPHVNQAEVSIDEVVVKMQALAAGRLNEGTPCAKAASTNFEYLVAALAALGRTSCRFGSGSSPCSTLCRF